MNVREPSGRLGPAKATWLIALQVAAVGCNDLPTEPITAAGDYSRTFELDGQTRFFSAHVPASVDLASPAPLLIAFHGVPSDWRAMRDITDFDRIAEEAGFVVAYASTSRPGDWNHSCRDCSGAGALEYDDVRYTRTVIDKLARDMAIDRSRVYAAGFSQGGLMTFRLACDLSTEIAAVATVAASILDWQQERCDPRRPVPILMAHGTEDQEFPLEGRAGLLVSSLPVADMVAHWATSNGCTLGPTTTSLPDVFADGTSVSRDSYSGCSGGAEVVFYSVEGGGHTWPGSPVEFSPTLGPESQDIVASEVIQEFLFRFSL